MPVASKELSVNKFADMCREFGGEFYKKEPLFDKEKNVYEFDNFEDYEAFIRWLNKYKSNGKTFVAKWRFGEGSKNYESSFEVHKHGKELYYEVEKSIGTPEGMYEHYGEKLEKVNFSDVFDMTVDKMKKEIDEVAPPYLRNKVDVEIGLELNYDFYYAKASALFTNPLSVSSTLEDMEKTTDALVDKAEDIFYEVINKEVGD